MSKYTVYLRRNKVNGKCYVGQTSNFKWREYQWRCLKCYYANEHLSNDRAKYGLDNWTIETLAETDTREEALELEQRFINDFKTIWPNGYNLSTGGGGGSGVKRSDETKKKMSESHKGKHHSEETKQKISENNGNPKKSVYQYTLDGVLMKVWSSTRECGRNGYCHSHVWACCNGKQKTHKGYRWSYVPL